METLPMTVSDEAFRLYATLAMLGSLTPDYDEFDLMLMSGFGSMHEFRAAQNELMVYLYSEE